MKTYNTLLPIAALSLMGAVSLPGQSHPYSAQDLPALYKSMLAAVDQILIFDNHGHPGFADDPDVDAMASPPGSQVFRLRADNPELVAASKALFAYPFSDFSQTHSKWLVDRKAALRKQQGSAYFTNILDRLHVQTAIANRVSMPDYLDRKRFLWASFADSFLFPFNNEKIKNQNIDEQTYIPLQENKLRRELHALGLEHIPTSFNEYLQFVTGVLEADKRNGSIAIKFEAAYFRSLTFGDPMKDEAAAIYARYQGGGAPTEQDYTHFQDYVLRYLLREADRLHLAVHFHTAVGIGDFFSLRRGNVLNREHSARPSLRSSPICASTWRLSL